MDERAPPHTRFPATFTFGAATAAYQIEGAVAEDGRKPSIWDAFSHTPGRTADGDTGDVACDHYHRVGADLDIARDLGLDAYRFSVAWPRVVPDGAGATNMRGLDFYDRLVDACLERGLAPWPTLYHWDLPLALGERGGWTARATSEAFADYAAVVARRIGDRVAGMSTFNEPWCSALMGHLYGVFAPGGTDLDQALAAVHHQHLAHGLGVQAVALAQMATDVRQRVADGLVNKLLAMTAGFSKNNCATWTSWQAVAPHTEALLVQPGIETCVGGADNLEDNGRWTLMDGLRNYYTCTSALHAALDIAKALHAEVHSSLGSEHTSTADSQQDIANVLGDLGEYNEALTLCRVVERKRVVALGEDHPSVLTTQHNIAFMLSKLGEYDEALTLYREVARKRVDALGEDHPNVLTTQHNIAGVLKDLGEYDKALTLYRVMERKRVVALGEDHPSALTTQHNIAGVLSDLGEYNEALTLYRVVERKSVVALGEDHPSVLHTRHSIAGVLKDLGEYDEALTLYQVVERKRVVALGEDHASVLDTQSSIAGVLKDLGKYNEALKLYRAVEQVCRVDRGARPGSGKAATPHGGLAGCTGQVDEGQQVVDGALARAVAHLGPRHPDAVLYGRTLQSIRAHGRARSGPLPRTFSLTSVLAALLFCVALLIVLFLPWLLAKHG